MQSLTSDGTQSPLNDEHNLQSRRPLLVVVLVAAAILGVSLKYFQHQQRIADLKISFLIAVQLGEQSRTDLREYLLSGDTRKAEAVRSNAQGFDVMMVALEEAPGASFEVRSVFDHMRKSHRVWLTDFAEKLIDTRRQLDAGKLTLADQQIRYLQADPASWDKQFSDDANKASQIIENQRHSIF